MKAKYLSIAALALGMVACEQTTNNAEIPIDNRMLFDVVSPNAHTRVSNGAFEAEDEIGVYVTDYVDDTTPMPLQISGNRANNEALLFDGASWAPERTIYWGEGRSDVYAYYPFMEIVDVDEQPFSVALDQTVEDAYETSDFLWAKAEGVAQSDGAISLNMKHQMSRLVVKIMAGKEYIGSLPEDATVHLHSTVTDVHISLANGSVVKNPYSGANSIKMRNLGIRTFEDGEAVVYEAIVVPQMLETSVPLLEINSKSVSYLLEDSFNFKPGVSYTYNVVLNASTTAIKVEIGCEVEDWNNIGGGSEGEGGGSEGGEDDGIDLSTYIDLSAEGTANCYLVKAAGKYKFKALQGNSDWSVGNVKKTEVLWETFGTDVMPNVGDLIASVGYKNGYVYFSTPDTFKNGNASIAARNSKGVILWSWHIWCSEEGWNDHVYLNNAGIIMDRNLGATSATPGDVGALGLFYQWGRKDPFMGGSSIDLVDSDDTASSTGNWNAITGRVTIDYADENPTTFICNHTAYDWCIEENYNLRWKESEKTIYDPCPVGYRVPDGGYDGFWVNGCGHSTTYENGVVSIYIDLDKEVDETNRGVVLTLSDGITTAWYPFTGTCFSSRVLGVGNSSFCWTTSTYPEFSDEAECLQIDMYGFYPHSINSRGDGCSVRCVRE